jgi:Flp pilus assembly protein TadD
MFRRVPPMIAEFPNEPEAMKAAESAARLSSAGDTGSAIDVLTEATERWPSSAGLWLGLAIVRRQQGDLLTARADLAVALGLAPDDPKVIQELGRILRAEGRMEAAEAALNVGWQKYQQIVRKPAEDDRERYFRHGRATTTEKPETFSPGV